MPRIDGNIFIAAGLLAAFGIAGAGLVAFTHESTAKRIAQNERDALLRKIEKILPSGSADNDLLADSLTVRAPAYLGAEQTTIYRGRLAGEPTAVVFSPVEAAGYSGPIRLIIGVDRNGALGGVRVLSHRETPGLGDRVEESRSDWIHDFNGRSLTDPDASGWKVRRDGGVFDHFTGATITPRAIVRAVKQTLEYARDNWDLLIAAPDKIEQS
jgi:electron transport complex protein RnfG